MPQSAGRGLAAWPIRRKLIALVAVPVIVIIAAGVWLTSSSVNGLRQAQRTRSLAATAMATNQATIALDHELAATLTVLRSSTTATKNVEVQDRAVTDQALNTLKTYLNDPPSGGWSGDVLMAASSVTLAASQLPAARNASDNNNRTALVVETSYKSIFDALRTLTSSLSREIATTTADGRTVDQASMLAALASASSAAADERATGTIAITELRLSDNQLAALKQLAVEQDTQLDIAATHANPQQQSDIDAIRLDDKRIKDFRVDLDTVTRLTDNPTSPAAITAARLLDPVSFAAALGQRLSNLDALVGRVAQQTRDQASDNVRGALIGTIGIAALGLFTLLLIFGTLAAIARTVTGPMRRLRSGAVEVATVRLPQAVRQIEQQGIDATIDLPPVMPPGTPAGPETLEVAHAVDGLTAEAVRLATAQVRLRHALDEAFVSMSRRSQTMVEKQLAIIDELESTEEDPEQLRNLFRLDHLAARMRRYNDNLLVLAGSSVRTRSNTPVPVSDVFRAATSEMEQYERVRLQPVNSAAVAGPVAGGLIHLLAELLDNAAMYSPPTSPILLTAAFTPGGGLHLEVTDSGVGIPPAELAELNARLATPGTIDTQIPSRMGLFVVGRLAQRGGFEVRLSARASAAGTVAEVLVPSAHVVGAPQQGGGAEFPAQGRIPAPAQRTPGPLSPQGLPTTGFPPLGRPPLPPAALPPTGFSPIGAPGGLPPLPTTGSNPQLRPTPGWPGSAPQSDSSGPPTSGTPLPSRVPGAALSGGPLSAMPGAGRNGTPVPSTSPFDAFGNPGSGALPTTGPAPAQGPVPTGPSSATAAWSAQARAARAGGPADLPGGLTRPGDTGGIPSGFGTTGSGLSTGPSGFGSGPAGFGTGPSGFDRDPAPDLPGDDLGTGPDSGALPTRTPFSTSPGLPGPNDLPTRAPGTGWPAPQQNPEPANGTGLPTRPNQGGADPFATARLFGVEPPDPATAAGLFTPRQGNPDGPANGTANGTSNGTSNGIGSAFGGRFTGSDLEDLAGGGLNGSSYGPPSDALRFADSPEPLRFADSPEPAERTPSDEASWVQPAGADDAAESESGAPEFPTDRGGYPADTGGIRLPVERVAPLTGELPSLNLKPLTNPSTGGQPAASNGAAPAAWDGALPTEEEARSASNGRYTPADPDAPMIGNLDYVATESASIFDSMSAWFSDQKPAAAAADGEGTGEDRADGLGDDVLDGPGTADHGQPQPSLPAAPSTGYTGRPDAPRLIDLRDDVVGAQAPASRWASLGDQQWLAANARAASAPQVAGDTSAGLPRREPGANLLPSAASAAPSTQAATAPFHRADADTVRGRLGSYQRGVSSARRSTSRHVTTTTPAASLFTAARNAETDQGHEPDEQGGDQ